MLWPFPDDIAAPGRGLFNMAALGMRAFSGVTIGFFGAAVGIHWSLALACAVMLVAAAALLARLNSR